LKPAFGVSGIERKVKRAAAALLPLRTVPFIGKKVAHRSEQNDRNLLLCDPPRQGRWRRASGEEFLGQVLGIVRRVAAPAHEAINRIPIPLAEILKGFLGQCISLAGSQHNAPVSSVEGARIALVLGRLDTSGTIGQLISWDAEGKSARRVWCDAWAATTKVEQLRSRSWILWPVVAARIGPPDRWRERRVLIPLGPS